MDSVIIIGINAGLTYDAIMRMTVGETIDFAIAKYNADHPSDERRKKAGKRKATQADYDAFFG